MLGVNAYYDLKKHGMSGMWFDQWGMGFEAMGEFDDIMASGGGLGLTGRFNFYVPLSGSKSTGAGGSGGGYSFSSLGIYSLGGGGTVYEPLTGLDYEMGMRIPYLSNYVETWAYAGGYHYQGRESGHLDGFCGRIEVIPTDFLSLDFEYRNDNWYGDEFYGEVKVEVPFSIGNLVTGKNPFEGLGSRFGGSRTLSERMVEPVRRDIDIKIREVASGDGSTAGGLIEEIIFVSEGAELEPAASRDGSFEHPYASIGEATVDPRLGVTAFIIHVTNDNGGDGVAGGGNITIPNIFVWGSGVAHPGYPGISNMTTGYPTINGSVMIERAFIEVCGLHVTTTSEYGMGVIGGRGVLIRDNIISLSSYSGLDSWREGVVAKFGSGQDPLVIRNNTIVVNAPYVAIGVFLHADETLYASVSDNHMELTSDFAYGGIFFTTNNLIGTAVRPVEFRNNTGTIDGATARYVLGLSTGNPAGGNTVHWDGNTLTPLHGGAPKTWSGNYPNTFDQREIDHNFDLLGGDTISP